MLQKQKLNRRALYVVASGCALLATLLCPSVLGPVAALDGEIGDVTARALLWLAAIAMGIAGISLIWMARNRSRGARAARSQFGNWLELGWNRRYWLGASVLCAFVVASASLGFYVYRVNHVDLVQCGTGVGDTGEVDVGIVGVAACAVGVGGYGGGEKQTDVFDEVNPDLTLVGLRIVHDMNV